MNTIHDDPAFDEQMRIMETKLRELGRIAPDETVTPFGVLFMANEILACLRAQP